MFEHQNDSQPHEKTRDHENDSNATLLALLPSKGTRQLNAHVHGNTDHVGPCGPQVYYKKVYYFPYYEKK